LRRRLRSEAKRACLAEASERNRRQIHVFSTWFPRLHRSGWINPASATRQPISTLAPIQRAAPSPMNMTVCRGIRFTTSDERPSTTRPGRQTPSGRDGHDGFRVTTGSLTPAPVRLGCARRAGHPTGGVPVDTSDRAQHIPIELICRARCVHSLRPSGACLGCRDSGARPTMQKPQDTHRNERLLTTR
jgi:hypothetical protein